MKIHWAKESGDYVRRAFLVLLALLAAVLDLVREFNQCRRCLGMVALAMIAIIGIHRTITYWTVGFASGVMVVALLLSMTSVNRDLLLFMLYGFGICLVVTTIYDYWKA